MAEREPVTESLNVSEARKQWSGLLNRVARRETRFLIEKSGAPVAAVVSADDLRRLEELDARRQRDFAILDEIGQAFQDVSPEELEREVASALAEARAERRRGPGDSEIQAPR